MINLDYVQRIRQVVQLIPKGYVASYGQVADLAGLPGRARLVGRCLKAQQGPDSLPWFRVLRANGQIAFPMGSDTFQRQVGFLQEDGVSVLRGRVKMRTYQWHPDLADLLHRMNY